MVRIKIPESFAIKTISGKPFSIEDPTDWNLDELVEMILEDNADFFGSLKIQVPDDVVKGLIVNDILQQYEELKQKQTSKDALRHKIKTLKEQRQRKNS